MVIKVNYKNGVEEGWEIKSFKSTKDYLEIYPGTLLNTILKEKIEKVIVFYQGRVIYEYTGS